MTKETIVTGSDRVKAQLEYILHQIINASSVTEVVKANTLYPYMLWLHLQIFLSKPFVQKEITPGN